MSPYIYQEGRFLAAALCLGAGIAFVYDCLRIFRRVIAHGIVWISLEDLAYWAFVSVGIFCLLYYENNGAFRWFAILGAGLGMAVYKLLIGCLFVNYVSRFLLWIKKLCAGAVYRLLAPWRQLNLFLGKKVRTGAYRAASAGRLLKKRLTVQARLFRIELCKHCSHAEHNRDHGKEKDRY